MIARSLRVARKGGSWARRLLLQRTRPHALVLVYHRIAVSPADPWRLCVAPQNFAAHLAVLARRADVLPLADVAHSVLNREQRNTSRPLVAITFDDGYADNLERGLPLLQQARLPATIFVASSWVGRPHPFWWDRLAWLVSVAAPGTRTLSLDLPAGAFTWSRRDGSPLHQRDRAELREALWSALRPLDMDDRERALDCLQDWGGTGPAPAETGRPMTAAEVRQAAASGLLEIGAHSMTHPCLPELPDEIQAEEIAGSVAECSRLAGRPVTAFAYPHGRVDRSTAAQARAAGLRLACGGPDDVLWPASDPFALPRLSVHDLDGAAFERWLRWSCPPF